ncbi:MAG: DTW domain-containing protein [Polyangiales bacterium]
MRERPSRGLRGARCIRCRANLDACVCDVIATLPTLRVPSPVHLLLHPGESQKSTNTGWLATQLLEGTVTIVGRDLPEPVLPQGTLLLTPDATRVLNASDAGVPLAAIDAAWKPARRLRRKIATLRNLDAVALPEGAIGRFALRHVAREGHVSTAEALALAMGVLGASETEEALLQVFDAFVTRNLRVRGQHMLES